MATGDEQYLSDLTLKSVEIEGFRDFPDKIEINLKSDANFLIGRNGTGKTTLINIISDALSCRYQSLMSSPFKKIKITFRHSDSRYKPFFTVAKVNDEEDDNLMGMRFEFTDFKTKGPAFSFLIKSRFYRRNEDVANSAAQRRIKTELSKRFQLTWLALNRSNGIEKPSGVRSNDLDLRLEHSLQRLGTYFTRLDSKFAVELQKFQQEWFMSLLVSSHRKNPFEQVSELDMKEENEQIREMLSGIGILPDQFTDKVDTHISTAERIQNEPAEARQVDITAYIADLYDIARLHHWVEQWKELQDTKVSIYKSREEFLRISNSMLFKKTIEVDSGNRVYIKRTEQHTNDIIPKKRVSDTLFSMKIGDRHANSEIEVSSLSSGEKQLLIFLSESVLQSEIPHIFIADEPELSLHIEWQEKLVPVILDLNPNAQIFFATHSPDIVNEFKNNVFSMEELTS